MQVLEKLQQEIKKRMVNHDSAHDYEHIIRVYKNANLLCKKEKASPRIVLAAVLLHDLISYPKSDKKAKNASKNSSILAKKILKKHNFTKKEIEIICDAIENHSFSKNKTPKSLEGKILQDADRLDAIGAIGIARAFAVAGAEKRTFYNKDDPFCSKRKPNDQVWTVDHFYKKLLHLEKKMHTRSAKIEAKSRTKILESFLVNLKKEI